MDSQIGSEQAIELVNQWTHDECRAVLHYVFGFLGADTTRYGHRARQAALDYGTTLHLLDTKDSDHR